MAETGCCPSRAAGPAGELPAASSPGLVQTTTACPACGQPGKPVQSQTVKGLVAISLRLVEAVEYRFCRTERCPVVYFSPGGAQVFSVDQLRERVHQKEPSADDIPVCYCFRHTAGEVRAASVEGRRLILADIQAGIDAGQCACDLRNPQGACCLGNVRELMRRSAEEDGRAGPR